MSSRFTTLIFDLDDTLIPSSAIYESALKKMGVDPERYRKARADTKALLGDGHVCARNRLLYFKRYLETAKQFSAASVLDLMNRYEALISELSQSHWTRLGRNSFFLEIVRQYEVGIITNENSRTQLLKLQAFDPESQFFKWIVTSEEAGFEKPRSEIFQVAIERFGIEPSKAVMIGDSLEADIYPAQKLGFTAIWTSEFLPENANAYQGFKVAQLTELPSVLQSIALD